MSSSVLIVGDGAVGKTALLRTASKDTFDKSVEIPCVLKDKKGAAELSVLRFFDSSSLEEDSPSRIKLYSKASLILIVFSVISPYSFENVRTKVSSSFRFPHQQWIPEIRRYAPDRDVFLVGTKSDLRNNEEVLERLQRMSAVPIPVSSARKMRKEVGALMYAEINAKSDEDVQHLVEQVNLHVGGKRPSGQDYTPLETPKKCDIL